MRRLVEPKVATVIDGGETLVGALGIMHAVITLPAGHQWRDHDLGADCQRLAHEIFRKVRSRFDNDAAQLMTERKGPRQRLRPVTFEDVKVGPAHAAGADRNESGFFSNARPLNRADERFGARASEGGNPDGAVAHGEREYPVAGCPRHPLGRSLQERYQPGRDLPWG